MGTRLNYIFCFSIILMCFFSCKSKKEKIYQSKESFIQAFKASVFYGCYNSSTNQNFSDFVKDNNDLGLAPIVAVIYHSETKMANQVGEEYSKQIKPSDYGDYEGRSPFFSSCAYYAFYSKEVDSIAISWYNKNKKAKMEYIYD